MHGRPHVVMVTANGRVKKYSWPNVSSDRNNVSLSATLTGRKV